ncbi:methyl-accepting chemotaxis protein [Ectothiorhodospira shaposhnikovii]|uniref:methyl-accepting chemotaxis protein n=1 Tax=Ectothiorhodospira shaposhnikovii TaxID=1054 RepID=UPI001EE975FD|nr:methyl-accepting chemotaxis protein [Ectothiorhodospira shaposhnikovii]MCG5513869.1 methyl-accepting chemotaxis protein [Ectothiorhodospira shaposhnikovii]
MKITIRLMAGATVLTGLAVLLSAVTTSHVADRSATQVIEHAIGQQFQTVADGRQARLLDEMQGLENLLQTLAHGRLVQDAVYGFIRPFASYRYEVEGGSTEQLRQQVGRWYEDRYAPLYAARTGGLSAPLGDWLGAMSHEALLIQRYYVADNPHDPEDLKALVDRRDGSIYGQQHLRYHQSLRDTLERLGFNDLMLIDAQSLAVIYSVTKGPVFGTSLRQGPFSDSALGALARGMMANRGADGFRMAPFEDFSGRFNEPVVFIGVPVFHAVYSPERPLGMLVAEIPAARFTQIMTNAGGWVQAGLGATGESYLVDERHRLVTELRPMLENRTEFLRRLQSVRPDALSPDFQRAAGQGRIAGHLTLDTGAVRAALAGHGGMGLEKDYLGRDMFMAWTPLEIAGHRFALVTQQDPLEIMAPLTQMRRDLSVGAVSGVIVLSLLAALASWWFARLISRPLRDLARNIGEAASHQDLTRRFSNGRRDEIGMIATALDGLFRELESFVGGIVTRSGRTAALADGNAATSEQCLSSVHDQRAALDALDAEATAMESATDRIVEQMQRVAESASSATRLAEGGQAQVRDVAGLTDELARQVTESSAHLQALQVAAGDIDSVLTTIRKIAEQTNLLALNAAIEAARAGEQGRGFAVVAEQVRGLAADTREATGRIQGMVERLHGNMREVVDAMENERQTAERCVTETGEAVTALVSIGQAVEAIRHVTEQVSGDTDVQRGKTLSMRRRLEVLLREANQTELAMAEQAAAAREQKQVAAELDQAAGCFRISSPHGASPQASSAPPVAGPIPQPRSRALRTASAALSTT